MRKTLVILLGSFTIVIVIKMFLADIPETWSYGQETGEIVCELSLAAFFAAFLYLIQLNRYRVNLKNKFHSKTFVSYFKEGTDDKPIQTIKLSVDDNLIRFKGSKSKEDEDPFEGEIVMSPINLKIGEGFHHHKKSEAYGFIKVIIKNESTLFVDAPYIKMEEGSTIGIIVPQAFVWRLKK